MLSQRARILVIDDNAAIHDDFRQILDRGARAAQHATLDDFERALGGSPATTLAAPVAHELTFAFQGEEGVRAIERGQREGQPYAVAFVDIRMPPGIDGVEAVLRMWQHQPELEIVLCSAHNDYAWEDIASTLDPRDRLVVLRKPFESIEVRQLAACLAEKWQRGRAIESKLRQLEGQIRDEIETRMRERQRHEDEQRRGRRLEALGQLAAGLAHEINTPMQFTSSSLEYLAEMLPALTGEPEDHAECVTAVGDARLGLERIAHVVRTVRSHAYLRDREGLVAVDVNEQVRVALELARHEVRHDADAVVDLSPVEPVLGDPGDLCAAILNLVINAAHAIRDRRAVDGHRGVLTVTTRSLPDHVRITITDTGNGIPAAIRDRVFEPFFTTKPLGQGTGQGLSIARATVVDRHRGSLRFETETGKGTTFFIDLPKSGGTP